MRGLAAQYLCRITPGNIQSNGGSSSFLKTKEELTLEEQAERKIGWVLKLIFAGTASAIGYQLFHYMDERRLKILEMVGAKELVKMLDTAKDNRTRKEALKALSALSGSDKAATAFFQAGAISVIGLLQTLQRAKTQYNNLLIYYYIWPHWSLQREVLPSHEHN